MHAFRLFVAAVVAIVGFAVLTPITAASAASPTISASVSKPLAGERFSISGSLGASGARRVRLQAYSRSAWRTIVNEKSSSRGGYSFASRVITAATKFRVYAPRAKVGSKVRGSVRTRTLAVGFGGTSQSVVVDTLPEIVQSVPSSAQQLSSASLGSVRARFSPVRPGRSVRLSSPGVTSIVTKQNSRGQVQVARSGAQSRTWTATALPFHGAASATATSPPTTWRDAFVDEFNGGAHAQWQHRYPSAWLPGRTCSYISPGEVRADGNAVALTTHRGAANKQPKLSTAITSRPSTSKFKKKCKDKSTSARVYASSSLTSKPFTFSYGVAAARIKFDAKRGQNAAFWLQYVATSGTEIDVIESGGQSSPDPVWTGLHQISRSGNLHTYRTAPHSLPGQKTSTAYSSSWYRKYHVVSVEWTPSVYIFRIDGKEYYRTSHALSGTRHEIVLSNVVPDWAIIHNSGASSKMSVDWVRVWQK